MTSPFGRARASFRGASPLAACLCLLSFLAGLTSSTFGPIGRAEHEDSNRDGRIDVWRYYDRHGHVDNVFRDANFDGHIDTVEDYRADRLARRELDRNFDDRIDVVEEFDGVQATRTTADLDSDGVADTLVLSTDTGAPVVCRVDDGPSQPAPVVPVGFAPAPFVDPFSQSPSFRSATTRDDDLAFTASASSVALVEGTIWDELMACGTPDSASPTSSASGVYDDSSDRAPPIPA
jgi:hypothetical protein